MREWIVPELTSVQRAYVARRLTDPDGPGQGGERFLNDVIEIGLARLAAHFDDRSVVERPSLRHPEFRRLIMMINEERGSLQLLAVGDEESREITIVEVRLVWRFPL